MEKIPNKYAMLIRIICYILIPILLLAIIQASFSLLFFATQKERTEAKSYFETKQFSELYQTSIYANVGNTYPYYYSTIDEYEAGISNHYGVNELTLENMTIYYKTYLEERNFKFLIIDNKTNKAFTNLNQTMKTDTIEEIVEQLSHLSYYWNYEKGIINTNITDLTLENVKYYDFYKSIEQNYDCTIYTAMQDPLQYYDDYYTSNIIYQIARASHETALINIPLSIALIIVCIVLITICVGKKRGKTQIELNRFDKFPLEIIVIATAILLGTFIYSIFNSGANMYVIMMFVSIFAMVSYINLIILYETIVKRIKTHTFFKSTLIYMFYKIIQKIINSIISNINLTIKIGIFALLFEMLILFFERLCFADSEFIGVIGLIGIYFAIFYFILTKIKKFSQIKEMTKQIYEGNTQIRLQEEEYTGNLKEMCIYLNDIAGGFQNATNKSLKSERMKTELITNVSHDIKTPLTSIINYVDLLKQEEMPNEKAKEYLNILDQKSQRLKRLTEDLVEASKASSGNIKLNIEQLDINELIKQVSGEFEDKLKQEELQLIMSLPEEKAIITADSRYMYRVIENLYSNIVKYAMPNSRVYVDVTLNNEIVQINLKNISKEKLNISADELMERFVRGESSRNTEGSGLGLSIAQSLTELQKGIFQIYLDGDLFKVILKFKQNK